MTDVSKELRTTLAAKFTLDRPEIVAEQISIDGTRKWLLRLPRRGHEAKAPEIETVYIPEEDRGTLCISSQVGCTLTCSFCHTGTQRLVRNLEASEIVGQIMLARDRIGDWPGVAAPDDGKLLPSSERKITNIVLMGMGEPLYNFENVKEAMEITSDGEGISLSKRRITLSTSGVVPEITRWGEESGTMLAISLHAVRDELRDELVPINKKYPIAELIEACRNYPGATNAKRITFEYVMLKGVNDSLADAKALVKLLAGVHAKINLIPFNPWPGTLRVLGLGDHRALRRCREQGRICEPRAHAARPRYSRRLRAAEIGERQAARQRARRGGVSQREGSVRGLDVLEDRWTADPYPDRVSSRYRFIGFVAITLGLEKITHAMHGTEQGMETIEAYSDLALKGWDLLAGVSILPALAVVIVGEVAHIRSWLYYMIGGGLRWRLFPCWRAWAKAPPRCRRPLCGRCWRRPGLLAGLVYWLVAGRRA